MYKKVQGSLGQGNSQASQTFSNSPVKNADDVVSHRSITEDANSTESVVPSVGFLRQYNALYRRTGGWQNLGV